MNSMIEEPTRHAGRTAADVDDPAFDVRRPLAFLFGALGALLAGYGYATRGDAELYVKSGYVNVNVRWGLVLLGFAALMTLLALASARLRRGRVGDAAGSSLRSNSAPPRDE